MQGNVRIQIAMALMMNNEEYKRHSKIMSKAAPSMSCKVQGGEDAQTTILLQMLFKKPDFKFNICMLLNSKSWQLTLLACGNKNNNYETTKFCF